jgi:dienelactone hydrolase
MGDPDPTLPNVLLLGDSISIGYTLEVRQLLSGKANVYRPMNADGSKPENCQGTSNSLKHIDRWLDGREWDLIHFNWGLHDLKRVKEAGGSANSTDLNDPYQATVEQYGENLEILVAKLKATGARLIFATTTPVVPESAGPLREPEGPARYNAAARSVIRGDTAEVNDLYAFSLPRLAEIQIPQNVHFTPEGSKLLAQQVAAKISGSLPDRLSKSGGELRAARAAVLALGELTESPTVRNEGGESIVLRAGDKRAIYFDALEYEGRSTRAYALVSIPAGASPENPVPGIVLVHGGGGSAFQDWVDLWAERGYAAISIAVEGQTDEREPREVGRGPWVRHEWAGPSRTGIYGDMEKPLSDQWMYHAVADTVLANSLLRNVSGVDAEKVGIMGISWGGVITSTVVGIDNRFAFAIPTYGCGHKFDSANQYGAALGKSDLYQKVWDPMVRLHRATMPVQWLSWPGDKHFPMEALSASYRAASGQRLVTLIPGMGHGHGAGWRPADSYAFADSVVNDGAPWARQIGRIGEGDQFTAKFQSAKPLHDAVLVSTQKVGFTGHRNWVQTPVELSRNGNTWTAVATVPEGSTAWFINVRSGDLTLSSDYEQSSRAISE